MLSCNLFTELSIVTPGDAFKPICFGEPFSGMFFFSSLFLFVRKQLRVQSEVGGKCWHMAAEESADSTQTNLQGKSKANQYGEIKFKKILSGRKVVAKLVGGKENLNCHVLSAACP